MAFGFGFGMPRSFAAPAFTPRSLFSTGAQGAWYDPSDRSTLFQDAAGTTPVTAVEQPVGLMLDKSKGLVLGSELRSTGVVGLVGSATAATYNTSTGVGSVTRGADAANQSFVTFGGLISGTTYRVSLSDAGASIQVRSGTQVGTVVGVGVGTFFVQATGGSITITSGFGALTFTLQSVRELPGNHAFQTTAASRPVLSARVNLLTNTDTFYITGSPWFASGFSTSSTANNLIPSTSSVAHTLGQTVATTVNAAIVAKLWIKPNGYNTAVMQLGQCVGTPTAFFNAATGVITSQSGSPSATMVLQPDGYYECTINGIASSTTPRFTSYVVALDNTTLVFAGDGTSGLLYQKVDVRVTNQGVNLPAYQRVNTATDYDTVGFKPYLLADGVDDGMVTNSINFTATDKMTVCAGVRKLSDASTGVLMELSPIVDSNNGVFAFVAPTVAAANSINTLFKGTVPTTLAVGSSFASPITGVVTAQGDISGDISTQRINGAQVGASTGDQGTGNFGNYPLYLFRRGGTTLPFNGRMYEMTIVGKTVTAGELVNLETYTNQKTGAY